jgi:L-seryl-tRNA(Ser) seleniumtransferase
MDALRQIPPVNDVLRSRELAPFTGILRQQFVTAIINSVISDLRQKLSGSSNGATRAELTSQIANDVAHRLQNIMLPSLRRVINATGVVIHTNLGRAPLPGGAIEELRQVATGYSNLEFNVDKGERGKRDVHVGRLFELLLGCEAAIVVNNNAAAVLLVLNALGEGGEVIASRGEQVEIGESFRIPEIMSRSGARLREVGSTNRTRIQDYESAIDEKTLLLLRVHPSNFRMIGFTSRPSLEEFVDLGRRRSIPTYEDLGSGCLTAHEAQGDEPTVIDSLHAGIDVVSFSGDKLLGGPQAGIIAGKKLYVEKIRRNPLFRALRVDKLTIAVLEYVLRAYLRGDAEAVPTWRMLRATEADLKARAEAFAQRVGSAKAIALDSIVGGGSAPEVHIASYGIVLEFNLPASVLADRLRRSDPPVITRIEDDRVVLDFRTIFEAEEETLARVVCSLK